MGTMVISLFLLGAVTACGTDTIQLAADGETDYRIVVADDPSVEVVAAAGELAGFLKQVTGAEFPVIKGSSARSEHQIMVGRSPVLDEIKLPVNWKALGPEGFVIRTVGRKLVIAGGPRRGTINGVYTFLEDIIGCRWYTPKFSVIPHKPTLTLPPLNVQMIPDFDMRWLERNPELDWAARQRLNYFPHDKLIDLKNPKLAGSGHSVRSDHHTLVPDGLLPYAEFDKHPEYFALVKGKRMQKGQPCLTNPGLFDVIIRNAKTWIEHEVAPGRFISISGGDFGNLCECPKCTAVRKKHGWSGGEMLFVNKVAAELEKDYPDLLVDTLAYSFTQSPPADMTMHKNVQIRYCPIHLCYHHAFDECDYNLKKRHPLSTLAGWIDIAPRVCVWYYALPPAQEPLYPYPNINCLSRNFKLMHNAGVKGLMIQNRWYTEQTGGLVELKDYLYVKLLWNPDYDVQKGIEEFCRACYGAAAPQIIAYVKLVNDTETYYPGEPANDSFTTGVPGMHVRIGRRIPIKKSTLVTIKKLFDKAERTVANDAGSRERVKRVKLSLEAAMK